MALPTPTKHDHGGDHAETNSPLRRGGVPLGRRLRGRRFDSGDDHHDNDDNHDDGRFDPVDPDDDNHDDDRFDDHGHDDTGTTTTATTTTPSGAPDHKGRHLHWFAGSVSGVGDSSLTVGVLWTGPNDGSLNGQTLTLNVPTAPGSATARTTGRSRWRRSRTATSSPSVPRATTPRA